MAYITIGHVVNKDKIIRINNDSFLIEYNKDDFLACSTVHGSTFWLRKQESIEDFKARVLLIMPPLKNYSIKTEYLCFFRRFKWDPMSFAHDYTTFTSISYDDYEKIFLLLQEIFIKDLFPTVWKIVFSLCVTDKNNAILKSMNSTASLKQNHLSFQKFNLTCPQYTYIFDD